eukprot:1159255-Pelagomonas_calceolata.AAC.10
MGELIIGPGHTSQGQQTDWSTEFDVVMGGQGHPLCTYCSPLLMHCEATAAGAQTSGKGAGPSSAATVWLQQQALERQWEEQAKAVQLQLQQAQGLTHFASQATTNTEPDVLFCAIYK